MSKAFLFDMNGTMINDMPFHSVAWFDILNNDLNAGLTKAEVDKQMYGKNDELLVRVFGAGRFTQEEMDAISLKKEKRYQKAFLSHLKLIDGLDNFLRTTEAAQVKMAIGTAAIPINIDFVLDGLNIRHYFSTIVSANDVAESKPNPEVFLKCAALLDAKPEDCIVFEDAPKGVEAARNAGMKTVVINTVMHTKDEFEQYDNVIAFIDSYNELDVEKLLA
ncbi:HAD family hydrolase [Solitalea canadensis]|uniref:Haloacid dehalogenase superfamily protein, subfamily IA, variant 3 with third motif having DD or ED n=1 Tax=Solitalea canadensis (strain ATCC 29591 / DSM 3403 / JCM 21819 / LMG 8368 / NBRC 15130 / NCIMB 12057 / USAM 9D) TaxID=929556 RepID=H8KWC9_SOLCM|nr:HAD family phosphatase [Solitalea canadensis]AFD07921.1 haloacid dehalogenase superfamily protein, subfamily IA, variant 3 with third motif having DD or ED [Solitalea canadensis DSM 3403]